MSNFILTEKSNLVAVADAIRSKTGQTGQMTLNQMISSTNNFAGSEDLTSELSEQDELIAEIQTALEGKVAGGEPVLQNKTVTPTTSVQSIKADSGYDGLGTVTVNAMPTATQATPSISVSSAGEITASSTQTAGYVAAGTKSATKQLTVQAAKTITPSTSSQTAVVKDRYTTGAVTVAAIPSSYVQPTGTLSITSNGTHDVKSYASVNVNVASSGGGSIETCSGEIIIDAPIMVMPKLYFVNASGELCEEDSDFMGLTVSSVMKNSIVYITNWSGTSTSTCSGGAQLIEYNDMRAVYYITGDFILMYG